MDEVLTLFDGIPLVFLRPYWRATTHLPSLLPVCRLPARHAGFENSLYRRRQQEQFSGERRYLQQLTSESGTDTSRTMTQPPDAARLAHDLSKRIMNHTGATAAAVPGKAPLKLLQWALSQLEECARTHSVPASNVVEVAMAAIKDEMGVPAAAQQPNLPVVANSPPAAGVAAHPRAGGGASAVDGSSKVEGGKGGTSEKKAGGRSGGGGRSKGKVVFTPLYGCDEGATGVGPVSSILEVSCKGVVHRKRQQRCSLTVSLDCVEVRAISLAPVSLRTRPQVLS